MTDYPYAGDTTRVAPNQPFKGTGLGLSPEVANPGFVASQSADVPGRWRKRPVLEGIEATISDATLDVSDAEKGQISVTATWDYAALGHEDPIETDVTSASTYESSDPTKATVSAAGLVTPVAAGTATITVTYGEETDTILVTVQA